jgi:hypothetical protein
MKKFDFYRHTSLFQWEINQFSICLILLFAVDIERYYSQTYPEAIPYKSRVRLPIDRRLIGKIVDQKSDNN